MNITDQVIREKLSNVYFIWGRGKTTIARALQAKHGFYLYSTDDSREWHMTKAAPEHQPYMCRDYVKEYGVKRFWALPREVIADRERHFLAELTSMIISDLVILAAQHRVVLCEGDIDYEMVIPVASHMVHLCNAGTAFDWFERPDHRDVLDVIRCRTDLSEQEKDVITRNAYQSVAQAEGQVPDWVTEHLVKNIVWDDRTSVEQTVAEVERYFAFA